MAKKKAAKQANTADAMSAQPCDLARDPISGVMWVHRDQLKPNHYNPNRVAPAEVEGLIISILEDGWTQPIVVRPDYTIVDGFHRYTVSADPRLITRYGGMVPVVMLAVCDVHAMMSTIRHNRMRGTHGVLKMATPSLTRACRKRRSCAACRWRTRK